MPTQGKISFVNQTATRDQVEAMIADGEFLIIAGDEDVLQGLPSGNWIAGTIPYFMSEEGGKVDKSLLYVNRLDGVEPSQPPRLTLYDTKSISRVAREAPEHGFSVLILPFGSQVHMDYAHNSPDYPNMFFSPIIGWIAGMHLDDLGSRSAKVGFGPAGGLLSDSQAAAMHIPLSEEQVANINIVNLFEPGKGPVIRFEEDAFDVDSCTIDGDAANLAQYIKQNDIDTRLPLVANYCGVMINVSVQAVAEDSVKLYAPIFKGVEYRFAEPVDDYVAQFGEALPARDSDNVAFCCNCILNYLYSDLEGKKTGKLTGPMTFGEVGYQLLNQTLVYLTLDDA